MDQLLIHCLSAPNFLSPCSASWCWAWDPTNPISALPTFFLFRSATRGTGDFKAPGERRDLLLPSTCRDPLFCTWLPWASGFNASAPWQEQILSLAAPEHSLRFWPTLEEAASSASTSLRHQAAIVSSSEVWIPAWAPLLWAPASLSSSLEVWEGWVWAWQGLASKFLSVSFCSFNPSTRSCFLKLLFAWYRRVSFKLLVDSLLVIKNSLKFPYSNNWCHFFLQTRLWLLHLLKIVKVIFFIWIFKITTKKYVYMHT